MLYPSSSSSSPPPPVMSSSTIYRPRAVYYYPREFYRPSASSMPGSMSSTPSFFNELYSSMPKPSTEPPSSSSTGNHPSSMSTNPSPPVPPISPTGNLIPPFYRPSGPSRNRPLFPPTDTPSINRAQSSSSSTTHNHPLFSFANHPYLYYPASSRRLPLRDSEANPSVDWTETPLAHVFEALVPGASEVKVQTDEVGRLLYITGLHKNASSSSFAAAAEHGVIIRHQTELPSGRFQRHFSLPENARLEKARAVVENGLLTITVPKDEKPKLRSIVVEGGGDTGVAKPVNVVALRPLETFTNTRGDCILPAIPDAEFRYFKELAETAATNHVDVLKPKESEFTFTKDCWSNQEMKSAGHQARKIQEAKSSRHQFVASKTIPVEEPARNSSQPRVVRKTIPIEEPEVKFSQHQVARKTIPVEEPEVKSNEDHVARKTIPVAGPESKLTNIEEFREPKEAKKSIQIEIEEVRKDAKAIRIETEQVWKLKQPNFIRIAIEQARKSKEAESIQTETDQVRKLKQAKSIQIEIEQPQKSREAESIQIETDQLRKLKQSKSIQIEIEPPQKSKEAKSINIQGVLKPKDVKSIPIGNEVPKVKSTVIKLRRPKEAESIEIETEEVRKPEEANSVSMEEVRNPMEVKLTYTEVVRKPKKTKSTNMEEVQKPKEVKAIQNEIDDVQKAEMISTGMKEVLKPEEAKSIQIEAEDVQMPEVDSTGMEEDLSSWEKIEKPEVIG